MQAITPVEIRKHLRPLDMRCDLSPVADLIEECFADTLDFDGRQYVKHMRRAARHRDSMEWFSQSQQKGKVPAGFVWVDDGRVVANLSLIPCTRSLFGFGEKVYLIANVAVRAEYRRKGIAAALTRQAMHVLQTEGENPPWLHVRKENQAAYELYRSLGFSERFRRTTWHSTPHEETMSDVMFSGGQSAGVIEIEPRRRRDWEEQKTWFERAYPGEMTWHMRMHSGIFKPGLWAFFYRSLGDIYLRQWRGSKDERILGYAIWQPTTNYADNIWLAVNPQYQDEAVLTLLVHLRERLDITRPLALDYPQDWSAEAICHAGFHPHNTLIWMSAGVG